MRFLFAILDFIFGCHHRQLSRVFTIGGRTYRVCCDCGGKFKYSLASMSIERHFGDSVKEPYANPVSQTRPALAREL